jgi:hypothetical protein
MDVELPGLGGGGVGVWDVAAGDDATRPVSSEFVMLTLGSSIGALEQPNTVQPLFSA